MLGLLQADAALHRADERHLLTAARQVLAHIVRDGGELDLKDVRVFTAVHRLGVLGDLQVNDVTQKDLLEEGEG